MGGDIGRPVSQSLRKNSRSEFAKKFQWSQATAITSSPSNIVEYDGELRLAWRRLPDGTGTAELSYSPFMPQRAKPTAKALWSDGFEHSVVDISRKQKRRGTTCVVEHSVREQTSSVRHKQARQNTADGFV